VNRTEVVLLITPRVIRRLERPGVHIEQFNSGTELEVGSAGALGERAPPIVVPQPAAPAAQPSVAPPFSGAPPAAGPQPPADPAAPGAPR
jgi:general secretion pathway protein D